MALLGGLRLIGGLAFSGIIVALCLWLLNRLFPATSNPPDETTSAAFQTRQTFDHPRHKQNEPTGVAQHHDSRSEDERLVR